MECWFENGGIMIPEEAGFTTKPALALQQVEAAPCRIATRRFRLARAIAGTLIQCPCCGCRVVKRFINTIMGKFSITPT